MHIGKTLQEVTKLTAWSRGIPHTIFPLGKGSWREGKSYPCRKDQSHGYSLPRPRLLGIRTAVANLLISQPPKAWK